MAPQNFHYQYDSWIVAQWLKQVSHPDNNDHRKKKDNYSLWLSLDFIYVCVVHLFLKKARSLLLLVRLIIPIVVFSLNLSKHNSSSQSLQIYFTSNETFPRSSQNHFPSHLIDWIPRIFLAYYSHGKWKSPCYPYRSCDQLMLRHMAAWGVNTLKKRVMLGEGRKGNHYVGNLDWLQDMWRFQ